MTGTMVTGFLLMALWSVVQPNMFPDRPAVVNRPATLPCTCSEQVVEWSNFTRSRNTAIAWCKSGMCQINRGFETRFSFLGNTSGGNYSLSINSTVYNDDGMYKCTCNGKEVSTGKLHVYVPWTPPPVFEGDNITLACYGDTRKDAANVLWKKDGETVLEYTPGGVYLGDGPSAGRLSMSEQNFQHGDLSLHISSVQLSDAGFYQCLIHRESREGEPRAVLLTVEKRQPEHQPPPCSTVGNAVAAVLWSVLGLVLLVAIKQAVVCVKKWKQGAAPQGNPQGPVQEEFPMITKSHSSVIPRLDLS